MSPSHFFDNAFGGSAHGAARRAGSPIAGREMVERMEARGMLVDVAHASSADDRRRPRHGGPARSSRRTPASEARPTTPGTCPTPTCAGSRRPAAWSGSGSGTTATGGDDVAAIARAIRYAVDVAGVEHVGLGSDFDGAVTVPIDATGLVQVTDALLDLGFDDASVGQGDGRQRDPRAGRGAARLTAADARRRLQERRDELGGPGGAIGRHGSVVERTVDLGGDRVRDDLGRGTCRSPCSRPAP